jgi:propanol-preferring alcohol dehydrogenase
VVALARRGVIDIHTEAYSIDQGVEVYKRLHEGKVIGRAVLTPGQPTGAESQERLSASAS